MYGRLEDPASPYDGPPPRPAACLRSLKGTPAYSKAVTFASMLSENSLNMCSVLTGLPAWSVYPPICFLPPAGSDC